jgi:hypothetical protein
MDAHTRTNFEKSSDSSFETMLQDTLKALHQRRLEISELLSSLEAQWREEFERDLNGSRVFPGSDRSELGNGRGHGRCSSRLSEPQP